MIIVSKIPAKFLVALALIVGAIIASGYFHYRSINLSEDPRIVDARKKMAEYNELMSENETGLALLVLDQIETIYSNTPGYEDSYETGVILNNRGSVFLIEAATDLINKKEPHPDTLAQARLHFENSINIYSRWLEKIGPLERSEVREMILPFFSANDPAFSGVDLNKIIEKRVDDIIASKIETTRRLSVSHTNLGIVSRYEGKPEEAKDQYEKALALWSENHVARDNLNRLLGLPPVKRNIIQQLFYEDKTAAQ